jgi:peptide deformylase
MQDEEDFSLIEVYAQQPTKILKILRTPSMEIKDKLPDKSIDEIIDKMKKAIYTHPVVKQTNKISGLAASQIGVLKKIVILSKNFEAESLRPLINPHYECIGEEEKVADWEMSLSLPLETTKVWRYPSVKVRYSDREGHFQKELLTGLNARIAQHYIDTLQGIHYSDLALCDEDKITFKTKEEADEFRSNLRKKQVESKSST